MAGPKYPCTVSFGTSKEKPSLDWLHTNLGDAYAFLFFETDTHIISAWYPLDKGWTVIGSFGKEK